MCFVCLRVCLFCSVSMLVVSRPEQIYFKTGADMKREKKGKKKKSKEQNLMMLNDKEGRKKTEGEKNEVTGSGTQEEVDHVALLECL